jgi:hypothetical protein
MDMFNALQWEDHPIAIEAKSAYKRGYTFPELEGRYDFASAKAARVFFPNGYGASIISGLCFYTDKDRPYELAVLCGNAEHAGMDCTTPITNDVVGYLTDKDVDDLLNRIALLEKPSDQAEG